MTRHEFLDTVLEGLKERLGDGYDLKYTDVMKYNGVVLKGLVVQREGEPISPTIYPELLYNDFVDEKASLDEVYERLMGMLDQKHGLVYKKDIEERIYDYNDVVSNLRVGIMSKQKNKELLNMIPHVDFLDLAVYFYIDIHQDGVYIVKITNHLARIWDKTANDLYKDAMKNEATVMQWSCRSIVEVLQEAMRRGNIENSEDNLISDNGLPDVLYVCTVAESASGASAMLHKDVMSQCTDIVGSDFYIIPSSRHEILLIPQNAVTVEELQNMVVTVNDTEVSEEDYLSDTIYAYSCDVNEVYIAE